MQIPIKKHINTKDQAEERKIQKREKKSRNSKKMTARNSILIRNAQKFFASIIDKEANKTVNENKVHWKKEIKSSEKKKEQKAL